MPIFRDLIDTCRKPQQNGLPVSIVNQESSSAQSRRSWPPEKSREVLEEVIKRSGHVYRVIEKSGRVLFVFEKCPYHQDDDGDTYECCVMVEADGRYSGSCKHNDTAGWKNFKPVIGWDHIIKTVLRSMGLAQRSEPQEPAINVDQELKNLEERWGSVTEPEQTALLSAAINRLAQCPVLERKRSVEKIKTITGLTQRTIESAFYEQKKALKHEKATLRLEKESKPPPQKPGLPVVEYVINLDTINKFFEDVTKILKPTRRFFYYGSDLVYIHPTEGLITLTEKNVSAVVSSLLEIAYCEQKEDKETGELFIAFGHYGLMRHDLANSFVRSPRVLASFPVLKHYTRAPFFDLNWNFVAMPGYHEKSCTYYDGPTVNPVQSVQLLTKVLADFFWKSASDVVNYLGALLTGLTALHWLGTHPMVVYNGNKPGVGKSLLSTILGIIIDGRTPVSISYNPNDEEFEKQLATRVRNGDACVVIDNAKKTSFVKQVESQILERSITDPILNYRRLGANEAITRPNTILFSITMNFALLSRDLRRRSLPINLEQPSNVRNVDFPIGNLREFVSSHRLEILAELAGMIIKRLEMGRLEIDKPARHSISQVWAETIDGILRCSSFHGFLDNFDESEHAFDPDYALITEICETYHERPLMTSSEWAGLLIDGVLSRRLRNRKGEPKPKRSQETIVGTFLGPYVDVPIKTEELGEFRLVCEANGAGHSKRYGFVPWKEAGC